MGKHLRALLLMCAVVAFGCARTPNVAVTSPTPGCELLGKVSVSAETDSGAHELAKLKVHQLGGNVLAPNPGLELAISHSMKDSANYFQYTGDAYRCQQ